MLASNYDQQCKYEESNLLRLLFIKKILEQNPLLDGNLLAYYRYDQILAENAEVMLNNLNNYTPSASDVQTLKELAAMIQGYLHGMDDVGRSCTQSEYSHFLCLFDVIIAATDFQAGTMDTDLAERMVQDYLASTKRHGNTAAHQALKEWLAEFYRQHGRGY
jgi:hypothetical protein